MNPIVLLHGALGAKSQLESLATSLCENGRTVYSMNFSSHGGEKKSVDGFSIEIFANDLLRFLNAKAIECADIFGYSMGGYVALWLATQHPSRVGRVITLGTKFDWSPESAEHEVKKMNPEKIAEKIPAFARLLESRHAPMDWKELMRLTAAMMTELGHRPLHNEQTLKTISNPVMILLGELDDMADRDFSRQVAGWLGNGKFELLPATPHPIEKVELPLLQKFLV